MTNRISWFFDDPGSDPPRPTKRVLIRELIRTHALLRRVWKRVQVVSTKLKETEQHFDAILRTTVHEIDDDGRGFISQREQELTESAAKILNTLSADQLWDLRCRTAFHEVAPEQTSIELPPDHPERLRDALVVEGMKAMGLISTS